MKVIVVTGIGGNVGQGVGRVLRALADPLRIVGVDVAERSGGSHLFDSTFTVPYAVDDGYAAALRTVCERTGADLVIPTTDAEAEAVAGMPGLPPAVVSPAPATAACHDKFATRPALGESGRHFVPTFLASDPEAPPKRNVVKPRRGRGSRDVHFDASPAEFDDSYVVQPRLDGVEFTTALYVRRDGAFHGAVTMERSLVHGTTMACRVSNDLNELVLQAAVDVARALEVRGPCNLQGVATDAGPVLFEVNCRFSGTTSIRHNFGFRDVEYAVGEWLFGRTPVAPEVDPQASAERILLDVIYPGDGSAPYVF